MDQLPRYGEWHLSNNLISADPPFAVLSMDFRSMTGSVRQLQHTTRLTRVARIARNKFGAAYTMGRSNGIFEAVYNDDQTLTIQFVGTPRTTAKARPIELVGGERPVSAWSTAEKLHEAIHRSLPKLPAEVRDEVAALLTPQALAIMAGVLVLWGVSHFFGVGEIADIVLLITGGLLLGTVAFEVGEHLGKFGALAVNAQTDADLDAAADHFAEAVSKGGVQVVFAVLLWRGGRAGVKKVGPPVKKGELPTNLNAVPPEKIPPTSRTPGAPVAGAALRQGEQPALAGVADDAAKAALEYLNRVRRKDLAGETDCWWECLQLQKIAGGLVQEGNATSKLTRFDHTMWRIGEVYVDTRPGMWVKHFRENPSIRAAVDAAVPGLAARLERGACLTLDEFVRFLGSRAAPRSPKFDGQPVRPPGSRG
jgi:hypothetical protein